MNGFAGIRTRAHHRIYRGTREHLRDTGGAWVSIGRIGIRGIPMMADGLMLVLAMMIIAVEGRGIEVAGVAFISQSDQISFKIMKSEG